MRMHTLYKVLSSFSISIALAACGGSSTPPADEPEKGSEESESKEASEDAEDEDKAEKEEGDESEEKDEKADKDGGKKAKKSKKGEKEEEAEAPSTDGPKFTRTAKDILLAPEVVFLFSFNDSEPKKQAEEKCSKASKDDAKKQNECMAKARKKFDNTDGFRFEKDDKGQWWWITVRKRGAKLVSIHKITFDIAKEEEKSITIKPTGRDKGTKPWANPPKEVVFGVPNDYQITQDDPKNGTLVYEAKIGILGDGSKDKR